MGTSPDCTMGKEVEYRRLFLEYAVRKDTPPKEPVITEGALHADKETVCRGPGRWPPPTKRRLSTAAGKSLRPSPTDKPVLRITCPRVAPPGAQRKKKLDPSRSCAS